MIEREPEEIRVKTHKFNVYKDPLIPNGGLMGYKAIAHMDSGYFFAPYVPLTQSPVVLDSNDALTRYKNKLIDEYFASYTIVKRRKIHRSITDSWEVSQFNG